MSELVTEVRTLGLDGARLVLAAAVEQAERLGVPVCIAVADRSGHLLSFARMDGAPLLSSELAQNKAYSVCAFAGLPTHEWFDLIKDEPALLHGLVKTDRLIVFGGGVPVRFGGELAGAVGVSGGTAAQDREIAEAGARALLARTGG